MNPSDKHKHQPDRLTTEFRVIRRTDGAWDIEDSARGDDPHTLVLSIAGPKRISAPGLLTTEAFNTWIVAMRDEGFDITLSDLDGNPAHLDE
jgi:hypothetical protein